jgi:hypothetical protein
MKIRDGTLRHHLVPRVFYGLLTESHTWKAPSSDPENAIKAITNELGNTELHSPREGLDFICVADLGCWSRQVVVLTEKFLTQNQNVAAYLGREPIVLTGMRRKYEHQNLFALDQLHRIPVAKDGDQ